MGWDGTLRFGGIFEDGTCENPMDSPVHHTGLWNGTGHWAIPQGGTCENPMDGPVPSHRTVGRDGTLGFGSILEDGTCENPIDSPVHPMGL